MKKMDKIQIISICVCIVFLGIICLVIPRAIRFEKDEAGFDSQLTNIERENLENEWLKKHITSVLEHIDTIGGCEAALNRAEGEIVGADVKVTMSAGSIGNDTLKTDITEGISKMLGIPSENIKLQIIP